MFNFFKNLFKKKQTAKLPPLEPRGVIAKRKSEMFTVSLKHNGGDCYEILVVGNLTGVASGVYRYGEARANQHFSFECSMVGAK